MDLDRSVDSAGMLDHLANFPRDLEGGFDLGYEAGIEEPQGSIWICGIGGSAIGGMLTGAWANERVRIPITISRGYGLPEGVEPGDMVICVSHSGNTEETLSAYVEALQADVDRVAITSGGRLGDWADEVGDPVVEVPGGVEPREGLGYSWFAQLGIITSWGQGDVEEVQEAVAAVGGIHKRIAPEVDVEENLAKKIARRAKDQIPVCYGFGPMAAPARRWATQFNENSKRTAFYGSLPEAQHNAIVAWQEDPDSQHLLPIVLSHNGSETDRVRLRYLEESMETSADPFLIEPPGERLLPKLATAVHIGDYASVYLALLRGIDPTPVEAIDDLKVELDEVGLVEDLQDRFEESVG